MNEVLWGLSKDKLFLTGEAVAIAIPVLLFMGLIIRVFLRYGLLKDGKLQPKRVVALAFPIFLVTGFFVFLAGRLTAHFSASNAQTERLAEIASVGLTRGEILRVAELFVLCVVAILTVLLVVRPLLNQAFAIIFEPQDSDAVAAPPIVSHPVGPSWAAVGFFVLVGVASNIATIYVSGLPMALDEVASFGQKKGDLLRMAEIASLSLVAIMVLLLVIYPLQAAALNGLPAATKAMRKGSAAGEEQPQAPILPEPFPWRKWGISVGVTIALGILSLATIQFSSQKTSAQEIHTTQPPAATSEER